MRTRESSAPQREVTTSIYVSSGGGPYNFWANREWCYTPSYETIVDDPSRGRAVTGGARFKTCLHSKWSCLATEGDQIIKVGSSTYARTNSCVILQYEVLPGDPTADLGFKMRTDVGGHISNAMTGHYDRWLRVKPTLASRANLSVFLYELRDIKRMFDLIPKRHFNLSLWRDVLRYVNSQHLNYNFGWKPFLRDVINVTKALASYETRLSRFVRQAGVSLKRHAVDPEPLEFSQDYSWSIYTLKKRLTGEIRHTSVFDYAYEIPKYSERELRFRAYLDRVGLNLSAANIWAVLPWSFVVDWFIDVGPFLDQSTTDWVQPWVTFAQASSSVKASGSMVYTLRSQYDGDHDAASLKFSFYHRMLGFPTFQGGLNTLDADKIRLLASLVGARIL